ncbi:MAG: dienelactone hydrolase family protein [Acidobacteriota bacterium]
MALRKWRHSLAALPLLALTLAARGQDAAPPDPPPASPSLAPPAAAAPALKGAFDQPPLEVRRGVVVSSLEVPEGSVEILRSRDRIPCGRDRVAVDVFRPALPGKRPAVILLHGTHGPGRAEKYYTQNAEELARSGYVALFLRYYDRGRKGRGNRAQWTETIEAALTYAASLPDVDGDRLALLGFSQGAFLALNDAPSDPRVRAVVAYYGGLSPGFVVPAKSAMPPTLLLHGTADRIVPVRRSLQTLAWLREEGRPADLVVYPGAGHGFCLNSRGGADRFATEDSWRRTLEFLRFHLVYPAWTPAVEPWKPAPPPEEEGSLGRALAGVFDQPPLETLPYLEPSDGPAGVRPLINPGPREMEELLKKAPKPRPKARKPRSAPARPKASAAPQGAPPKVSAPSPAPPKPPAKK